MVLIELQRRLVDSCLLLPAQWLKRCPFRTFRGEVSVYRCSKSNTFLKKSHPLGLEIERGKRLSKTEFLVDQGLALKARHGDATNEVALGHDENNHHRNHT
jgi:hypothetical protein